MKKLLYILLFIHISITGISQAIQLTNPTGGAIWPAYSIQKIEWTSVNIDNIKIDYSLDSGRNWLSLINSYPAAAGYYEWTVPYKTSDSCFFRIADIANPGTLSTNYPNHPFIIPAASMQLNNLPGIVYTGTAIPLSWVSNGLQQVNIYLSSDSAQTFTVIATGVIATNNYYNWIVPEINAFNCFIKIQSAGQDSTTAISTIPFAIQKLAKSTATKFKGGYYDGYAAANNSTKKILLTAPNTVDSIFGNTIYPIQWKENNMDLVNIFFSSDNGTSWNLIMNNVAAAAESYNWTVVNTATTLARIKIQDAKDSTAFDISDTAFIIRQKLLHFTYPDSTASCYLNTVVPVSWISGGVDNIRISLLNGNTVTVLSDSVPAGNQIFNWLIQPGTPADFRILITDRANAALSDTSGMLHVKMLPGSSAAKFKGGSFDGHSMSANLKPTIQLLYPLSKTILSVSNLYTIKWVAAGIDRVNIDFSADSGRTWNLIATDIAANAGIYSWKTPVSPSALCFLRIRDANDSAVFALNDTAFILTHKTILNITDSSNWTKGTVKQLEWVPSGVDWIRIQYKTAANNTWAVVKDSIPAAQLAFNWVISTAIQDSLWMMMNDVADTAVQDTRIYNGFNNLVLHFTPVKYHGGNFDGHTQRSNINKLIIQHPVANEMLIGGMLYNIIWTTVNLEDSIQLQYSADSGATWTNIAYTAAQNGSYSWQVPVTNNTIARGSVLTNGVTTMGGVINSTKCLIRGLDIANGNLIAGASSHTFSIFATAKKLDTLVFPQPDNITYGTLNTVLLKAVTTSGRSVNYRVISNNATIAGNTLTANAAGKITVAAYVITDSFYYPVDTIFRSFCANPMQPVITMVGDTSFCAGDSVVLHSSAASTNQWTLNGTAISGANGINFTAINSGIYEVGIADSNHCSAVAVPITVKVYPIPDKPVISWNAGTLSTSTSSALYQWLFNNNPIAGAIQSIYKPLASGTYQLQVTDANGCTNSSDSFKLVITAVNNPYTTAPDHLALLYPNPAKTVVIVQFKQIPDTELFIQITGINGHILKQISTHHQETAIPLTDLMNGTYYLRIIGKDYNQTQQLLLIR